MFTSTADVRRARPDDARNIADVHAQSWQNAYRGIVPYKALNRMINRRNVDWWAMAIRRRTIILVAEVAGEIAGYATLGPNRVSTFPYQGEIYEIYLKPEYQGIGLGSRLFLDARAELKRRGYSGMVVWVLADNDPAKSFYENAGGRAVARGSEHFDERRLAKLAYAWDQ